MYEDQIEPPKSMNTLIWPPIDADERAKVTTQQINAD
jgi:hypothetical protein